MHNIAVTVLPYRFWISRISLGLAVLCAVSVLLYGTFLLMAVAHAAKMSDTRHAIVKLNSKVSMLETQYLTATKALTRQKASDLGYVTPSSVATVYAAPNSSLTLNTR